MKGNYFLKIDVNNVVADIFKQPYKNGRLKLSAAYRYVGVIRQPRYKRPRI